MVRRLDVLVFLLLLGSLGYFHHSAPGWNVNSRYALALAWAETGSPAVERYVRRPGLETEDLAAYNGHLYSDKTIGTSLLGVPAVWVVSALESAADTTFATATRRWLVTFLSVGIVGALAGVLLMRWLLLVGRGRSREDIDNGAGGSEGAAAFVSLAVILGSMLFLHGTLFMSYLPATACLLGTMIAVEKGLAAGNTGRGGWWIFMAGVLGGLTVVCEYTYAAAVGLTGLYVMARSVLGERVAGAAAVKPVLAYGVGGMVGILPFVVYTVSIFGRPAIPYEYHVMPEFRSAMAQGFMGAGWPNLHVLWLISFHPFRGLFVYSPVMLAGLVGLIVMVIRDGARRRLALLCLGCVAFYFLFNSAYYMWWGGWSFSPRHLAPALPFLAVGVLPWMGWVWSRAVVVVCAAVGVVIHLLVNATEPQPGDGGWQTVLLQPDLSLHDYPSVFVMSIWPRVRDGALDVNLGTMMGLSGWATLMPLLVWWGLIGWGIWKTARCGVQAPR